MTFIRKKHINYWDLRTSLIPIQDKFSSIKKSILTEFSIYFAQTQDNPRRH